MRNIKWIGLFTLGFLVAMILWTATDQSSAQGRPGSAGDNCTVQNLGGTYLFAAFGDMHPSNPAGYPAGPYNSVATVVMDGAGNYTATAKTMYNGGPAVDEFRSGTYEVNGCGVLFTAQGLGTGVFAYFTQDRREGRGVMIIPGTNVTLLYVRK